MLWTSFLIGAQPRKGKTYSARLLALYAALDPYVRLTIIDGKARPRLGELSGWSPTGSSSARTRPATATR